MIQYSSEVFDFHKLFSIQHIFSNIQHSKYD
jgi:hypothetical protein